MAQHTQAQGITLSGGTKGVGLEVSAPLVSQLSVRGGIHYFDCSFHFCSGTGPLKGGDLSYTFDLRLRSVSLLLDWHPFNNVFRVSWGAFLNHNHIRGTVWANKAFTAGNRTYSVEEIGDLSVTVKAHLQVTPYLGIGLGNALRGSRVSMVLDLGIAYQHTLRLDLEGEGFWAQTARAEPAFEERFWSLPYYPLFRRFYPVAMLGFTFRL